MSAHPLETVSFTSKGQVVIPARLRKHFQIEKGSKAIVVETDEGILLKPVTKAAIAHLHGLLKPAAGAPALAEEWAEHKHAERQLEARRRDRA